MTAPLGSDDDRLFRQQRDNLCGAYSSARALRSFGIFSWNGERIDQDLLAWRAGALLPKVDEGSLPPGAASFTGCRYDLELVPYAQSGTCAEGLIEAIAEVSEGCISATPIAGRWTAEAILMLLDLAGSAGDIRLLANIRTGPLWSSKAPVESLIAELRGEKPEDPPSEWDVGHFVELEMLVKGPRGSLVLVNDAYEVLGYDGHYLQPPRAVAAALNRGDGREGGILALAPPLRSSEIAAVAIEHGLRVRTWDNGTPKKARTATGVA
jgi:hypothetical protein